MSPRVLTRGESLRSIIHARYSDGTITTFQGETPTYSAQSGQSVDDSNGTAWTTPNAWFPALHALSDTLALYLDAANDQLTYDWLYPYDQPFTVYAQFERVDGTDPEHLIRIGDQDGSNPSFLVEYTGTAFRVTYHNGTGSVTASVTMSVSNGDRFEVRASYNAAGDVTIGVSKNGGAEQTDSGTGSAAGSAWSDPSVNLVGTLAAAQTGEVYMIRFVAGAGASLTMADMRGLM